MNIDEETKEKLDLRIQNNKKIRELVSEVGKSSCDITIVPREHDIQQSQTTMAKLQWMIKSMERTAALRTTMTTCFLGGPYS
jgi:16S rRNA U1498 N3-methylase RsmE